MSYRVVQYNIEELIIDYDAVAESLNKACHRDHRQYRMSGTCQGIDDVIFVFEEDYEGTEWSYVIKPFPGQTAAEIKAEIHTRWQGRFSTRGLIRLTDMYLGVFERAPKIREHMD